MACVVSFNVSSLNTGIPWQIQKQSLMGLLIYLVPNVLEEQASSNIITHQLIWWTKVCLLQDRPGLTHYCHLPDTVLIDQSSNIHNHNTCNQQLNHGWPSWVSHLGPPDVLAEEIRTFKSSQKLKFQCHKGKFPIYSSTLCSRGLLHQYPNMISQNLCDCELV